MVTYILQKGISTQIHDVRYILDSKALVELLCLTANKHLGFE